MPGKLDCGDWIFWLDADEWLDDDGRGRFRALIDRIKTRYTLGYYTHATAATGKPHKLDVRLASSFGKKGHDYVILSKNSYYVH